MNNFGPNMTRLFAKFLAINAIPKGGGLADAVRFFQDSEHRRLILERAEADTKAAVEAIRSAPDNPWGDDDEAIAAGLLEKIEKRIKNNDQI